MPKAATTVRSREGCPKGVGNRVDHTMRTPIQHNQIQKCFPCLKDIGPILSPCVFCGRSHIHWLCPLEPEARTRVILESGKCTQCLKFGHISRNCQKEGCRKCGGKHHTWLHYYRANQEGPQNCPGFQRASNHTPPGTNNRWTKIHQYFYVRTPGSAPAPDDPKPGTSEETFPLNRAMPESWRSNNMTQLWRRNDDDRQHPTKNP